MVHSLVCSEVPRSHVVSTRHTTACRELPRHADLRPADAWRPLTFRHMSTSRTPRALSGTGREPNA